MNILAVNIGSSSIKCSVYMFDKSTNKLDKIKSFDQSLFNAVPLDISNPKKAQEYISGLFLESVKSLIKLISTYNIKFDAIAHRIVFSGPNLKKHQLITDQVVAELSKYESYDPQHMPYINQGIDIFRKSFPNIPQFACFDSAFFSNLPLLAKTLSIPKYSDHPALTKYGFHGLSYESIMNQLQEKYPNIVNGRIIIAHLGNGSSLCAINGKIPVDTTMSFSPASGIPMLNRSGDIDPNIVIYLLQNTGYSIDEVSDILNNHSGLSAITDTNGGMISLVQQNSNNLRISYPDKVLAIDYFSYNIRKIIGSFIAIMGGVDAIVFTGGIGAQSPQIRWKICMNMDAFGISIDPSRNEIEEIISSEKSIPIIHLSTDEELIMANTVIKLMNT